MYSRDGFYDIYRLQLFYYIEGKSEYLSFKGGVW